MTNKTAMSCLLLAIALGSLSGCGGGDSSNNSNLGGNVTIPETPVAPESPVENITLKAIEVTADTFTPKAAKGETIKLFATAIYSDGSHKTVTDEVEWIEETPDIISVSEKGEVSTLEVGTGAVIARLNDMDSEPFKVEVTQPELTGIAIDPRTKSVAAGFDIQLSAWGLYTDKKPRDITSFVNWHSSDDQTLTFSENGLAKGLKTGTTNIQASFGGFDSPQLPVEVTEAKLQSISITPNTFSLPLGTEKKLVVTGHFSDGSVADITQDITWEHGERSNVRIQNGVFFATELGEVSLTAKYENNQSASATITVTDAVVTEITVSPSSASIAKGTTQEFTATALYTDGETKNVTNEVTWESSDYRVLTINTNKASGKEIGQASVTAIFNGEKSTPVPVSVTAVKLTKITISPSEITLAKNNVKRFHAVGHYSDGTSRDISEVVYWDSKDEKTIALMEDGITNSIDVGHTTITATKDGVKASASIEVVATSDAATTIKMCGTGVDDKDRTNATGDCLKVASGDNGFWYTSPPSINLMNSLGYRWVHALSPEAQMPKTYNYVRVETGAYGPAGEFAMFNNYGLERQGNTGQWGYWCNELNEKNFANRTNWRRATMSEMFALYRKVGGSLWNGENRGTITGEGLGWPTSFDYWTMTSGHQDYVPYEGYYNLINMKNATTWIVGHLTDVAYASCVSEPETTTETEK